MPPPGAILLLLLLILIFGSYIYFIYFTDTKRRIKKYGLTSLKWWSGIVSQVTVVSASIPELKDKLISCLIICGCDSTEIVLGNNFLSGFTKGLFSNSAVSFFRQVPWQIVIIWDDQDFQKCNILVRTRFYSYIGDVFNLSQKVMDRIVVCLAEQYSE
jgi:hypothetical protein